MKRRIRRVAVLGSGVMGSAIAAHVANCGIPVLLLDIVPPNLSEEEKKDKEKRNMLPKLAIQKALKAKPAPFFSEERAQLIEIGNFEDDMHKIRDCDWIVEAVIENLEIKRNLFKKVAQHRAPDSIVSSNTSGIPLKLLMEGFDVEFQKYFLITHFFNPVRYMKLLELVPGEHTLPEVIDTMVEFGSRVLGKGIVFAKDTPNFVANRIGIHAVMVAMDEMQKMGLTIEEVDTIAGPPLGKPKSAIFRTMDIVGLDTFVHVSKNLYENLTEDEEREIYKVPDFIHKMIEKGWLGQKSGQGFYKKEKVDGKSVIYALDLEKMEYHERTKPQFESIKQAKSADTVGQRVARLVYSDDKAGQFAWKITIRNLVYAANRIGEIADDIVNIDRAMRWGFNWELGPFETWDAIDVKKAVERMQKEGIPVPEKVKIVLEKGQGRFYKTENGIDYYFDFETETYKPVPIPKRWLLLKTFKARNKVVKSNDSASLIDLGDRCLELEFHSNVNAIDQDIISMMWEALDLLESDKFDALVIYNEGQHFSVGANLMLIRMYSIQKKWDEIEKMVDSFQKVNTAMHRCSKPVVAAPHSMALGGGCEVCLGASHILAHSELYMGLVEVGVGLIPGGGGTKEMLVRWYNTIPKDFKNQVNYLLPYLQKVFEIIGTAKVSLSAEQAQEMLFLRPGRDRFVTCREEHLYYAKQFALGLYESGYTPDPPKKIPVAGKDGIALIDVGLYTFELGNYITEYDKHIGKKLGYVLSGGNVLPGTLVTEEYILELEREAFMSLLGEPKTQERILHMLVHKKPLRN